MVDAPAAIVGETWVYPVAGMQGIKMENGIHARKHSIVGDRRYAFAHIARRQDGRERTVLLHTKEAPMLLAYKTTFAKPEDPKNSEVIVTTPDGQKYDVEDPRLLAELSEVTRRRLLSPLDTGRNLNYSGAVSVISYQSIDDLSTRVNHALDVQRFRMNVVVDHVLPSSQTSMNKEAIWVGKYLHFGPDGAVLNAQSQTGRCTAIDLTPRNRGIHRLNSVFAGIPLDAQEGEKYLGVYTTIDRNGMILPGTPVTLR